MGMKWPNAAKPLEEMLAGDDGRASPPVNLPGEGLLIPPNVKTAGQEVGVDRPAVSLKLPLPPTTNTYYRSLPNKVLLSRQGRAYKDQVASIVFALRLKPFGAEDRLGVRAVVSMSARSKSADLDNRIKPLGDALQASGLIPNDSQIDEWHVRRGPATKHGIVTVEITVLTKETL